MSRKYLHILRIISISIALFISFHSRAAAFDTTSLKNLYDRCLDFDEAKTDSICIYAELIERESKIIGFEKGPVLSLRLKGICQEYRSDFNMALDYYLQSLDAARVLGQQRYILSAMTDVAMTYSYIGQTVLAKKYFIQCADLALKIGESSTLITTYNNLGATFNQLQQYDSALLYLFRAIEIGKSLGDSIDVTNTYNNIGNAYFSKKEFRTALNYFQANLLVHSKRSELGSKWVDHLNMADAYLSMQDFDSAKIHADESMRLASLLGSKSKEADSYSLLARYYSQKGDYKNAYENIQSWYKLDTSIVSGSTQDKIAELQERFNAKEREAENQALLVEVERQNLRSRSMMFFSIALGLLIIFISWAFIVKRNVNRKLVTKNNMIIEQNEKLAELNQEKNSLIGIVSHDLGSPFATIQLWGQILATDQNQMSDDQKKAVERVIKSANHGQELIKNILDIEKMDAMLAKITLVDFDIVELANSVIQSFHPAATQKNISISTYYSNEAIKINSDKQFVQRILENLLSNAIKYSPRERTVELRVEERSETVCLEIIDQGVGIEQDELPFLFSKYAKISSKPTNGEPSTGLGLSIVKKIVEDLNGTITCESKIGVGTRFQVLLKK